MALLLIIGEFKMITCKEDLVNTYIENDNGVLRDAYVSLCSLHGVNIISKLAIESKSIIEVTLDSCGECSAFTPSRHNLDNDSKKLTLADLLPTSYENTKVYSLDENVIRKYAELCGVEYKLGHEFYKGIGYALQSNGISCFVADSIADDSGECTTLTTEQILAAWNLRFNQPSIETLQSALDKSQLKVMELTERLAEAKGVKPPRTKFEYVVNRKSIFDLKDDLKRGLLSVKGEDTYHKIHTPAQLCDEWNNAPIYRRTEVEIDWRKELYEFIGGNKHIEGYTTVCEATIKPENDVQQEFDYEFIKMCHLVSELTEKPE